MGYVVRCLICHSPKPVIRPEVEDSTRYGACMSDQCVHLRTLTHEDRVPTSLAWLRNSNEENETAREMRDVIYENARADGREITRAPSLG